MRIAVYSGSFNPMHIGHIAIVRYLLDSGGFDKVYLVVSPRNPFKDSAIAANSDERLAAARQAISQNGLSERVVVEDIEFSMPQPSYTVHTLDALQAREPAARFTLIIGADNLPDMLKWHEGERLLSQYGIAVYPRDGFDMEHDRHVLYHTPHHHPFHIKTMKDAPKIEVSSTKIREILSRGEDASSLLA